MIGREIFGSFCVNYFEFEILKEENPPEQSRLGIVFSKGIFEGGRVISLYTMAFVQVMQSIDGQLASTLQKCVTQECGRGGGKLLEFDLANTFLEWVGEVGSSSRARKSVLDFLEKKNHYSPEGSGGSERVNDYKGSAEEGIGLFLLLQYSSSADTRSVDEIEYVSASSRVMQVGGGMKDKSSNRGKRTDTSDALDAYRTNHTEQPEFINEGEVDQNAEQCHNTCPLHAKLTDDKTIELSDQSLESEIGNKVTEIKPRSSWK
ncbi:hypothetical protein Tco_0982150 [Tanacetum coccineum]